MSIEHEAKFPLTDCLLLEARLKDAGELKIPWHFEANTVYDRDDELASSGRLLRLRRALVHTLTFKEPAHSGVPGVKSRIERESRVQDPDAMDLILRGLGFRTRLVYEKFRAVWAVDGGTVFLDILPFGHFAEIEAPAEAIAGIAARLGLPPADALSASYHRLNRQWRRSSGLAASDDFVFDAAERQRLNAALGCDARPKGEPC